MGERERNPISFLTKLVCAYKDVKPSFYPIKHFVVVMIFPLVYFHKPGMIKKASFVNKCGSMIILNL